MRKDVSASLSGSRRLLLSSDFYINISSTISVFSGTSRFIWLPLFIYPFFASLWAPLFWIWGRDQDALAPISLVVDFSGSRLYNISSVFSGSRLCYISSVFQLFLGSKQFCLLAPMAQLDGLPLARWPLWSLC